METSISKPFRAAGIMSILTVLCVMVSQGYLGAKFDWEGKPFTDIFMMYRANLPWIKVFWSIFVFGVILNIPLSMLFYSCFQSRKNDLLQIGTCFGVIAGFAYAIGIMRWVLLADILSEKFVLSAPGAIDGKLYAEMFAAFNVYAGNSFGETIAPLCHAAFLVCLGIAIISDKTIKNQITIIFAFLQIVLGVGIGLRPAEYAGFPDVGKLSDLILILWAVLFFLYGIYMIFGKDILAPVNLKRNHH